MKKPDWDFTDLFILVPLFFALWGIAWLILHVMLALIIGWNNRLVQVSVSGIMAMYYIYKIAAPGPSDFEDKPKYKELSLEDDDSRRN